MQYIKKCVALKLLKKLIVKTKLKQIDAEAQRLLLLILNYNTGQHATKAGEDFITSNKCIRDTLRMRADGC